jgi:GNAT superfamily N-acetyltransferase
MQPSQNPIQVFISSVQNLQVDDLTSERAAVVDQIRSLPLMRPWAFEETPASSDSTADSYMASVDACDIFVIVVGKEITEAVEREWTRATELRKPRLVFLQRNDEMSIRVKAWAGTIDVKYDRFNDPEDLRIRVKSALIDEIIKGYRRYQIQRQDYDRIAETIRSSAISFVVRTIQPGELETISADFPQLADLYPDLEDWIAKKRAEIVRGTAEAYIVEYEGRHAGFAVTSDKGNGVRKLSTLYILPEYQGLSVGPRLLYDVIVKAARDGCEKLYVTVSEERRPDLEPLLTHYGFFVEGVAGRRYRSGSWEWVWGKRLVHGVLDMAHLPVFVREILLKERGYEVRELTSNAFFARRRVNDLGLLEPLLRPLLCYVVPSSDDIDDSYTEARRISDYWNLQLVFVCTERPSIVSNEDLVIDAYDLETSFFPLFLRRPVTGLILSIQEAFARQLIPSMQQPQFFAPTRTQLRTDNVYYRTANQFGELVRGSPLFFYETQRSGRASQLVGEAKLDEFRVDEPREMFAAYGNLGVYTLDELERTASGSPGSRRGTLLGLKFDWYREFPQSLELARVKAIMPKYNSTTARRIDIDTALALREAAGWNVSELSFP